MGGTGQGQAFDQTEVESNEAEAKTQNGALSSKEREPSPKMEEESLVAREGACQDEEVHRQEKAQGKEQAKCCQTGEAMGCRKEEDEKGEEDGQEGGKEDGKEEKEAGQETEESQEEGSSKQAIKEDCENEGKDCEEEVTGHQSWKRYSKEAPQSEGQS